MTQNLKCGNVFILKFIPKMLLQCNVHLFYSWLYQIRFCVMLLHRTTIDFLIVFLTVIQFGFVTMFVASFPLAPLFALINNIVELRADAINFVVNYRRPVAEEVKDIGIWFKILEILTKISVLVNSFVIAFTTELIPRYEC